ncbi:hypothetical protein K3495_g5331 [Podosphaera aphanis]|nr:hypothetical protein K3495_g5331 [Podosphaera aphanis]
MVHFVDLFNRREMAEPSPDAVDELKRTLDLHQQVADDYVSARATAIVASREAGPDQQPSHLPVPETPHVIGEVLDIQARRLISDLEPCIRVRSHPWGVILPRFLESIPAPLQNNTSCGTYLYYEYESNVGKLCMCILR